MNVTWIIENISKEASYTELAQAVKDNNLSLIEIKGDYSKDLLKDLNKFESCYDLETGAYEKVKVYDKHCVIFNGSIEMAKLIRKDLGNHCQPVIYCDFEKFKCSNYYSYFGAYLFNDKYCLVSLSELNRNKFLYYGIFGKEALIFLRPDSGEKPFQAQLVDFLDFDHFYKSNEHLKHELVLISTPKNIKWEGRVIVSKDKIISQSTYRFQGQTTKVPSIPEKATELVNELLKIEYYPDSVFCYDLCQGDDDKFYLLELTSFSSCGLYASNKNLIVKKVSKVVWDDFSRST